MYMSITFSWLRLFNSWYSEQIGAVPRPGKPLLSRCAFAFPVFHTCLELLAGALSRTVPRARNSPGDLGLAVCRNCSEQGSLQERQWHPQGVFWACFSFWATKFSPVFSVCKCCWCFSELLLWEVHLLNYWMKVMYFMLLEWWSSLIKHFQLSKLVIYTPIYFVIVFLFKLKLNYFN